MGIVQIAAKIRGGVNAPRFKTTSNGESAKMPAPFDVVLPMRQHIGAACRPVVKTGDLVAIGQLVGEAAAEADAPVAAPIHASVSGRVALADGEAVRIESDGQNAPFAGLKRPHPKSREDFLQAVRQSGLVGLGGAGFPTHAKLDLKDGEKIDTLVINGAECEPYITADCREIMENPDDILAGIDRIMEYIGVKNCVIGIEGDKPDAIALLAGKIDAQRQGRISVAPLPTLYPYGAEKMLVKAVTGRTVPLGELPTAAGVLVLNITTVAELNRYFDTGLPLTRRRVTVAGGAVAKAQNVIAPVGARIRDIINFCGGYAEGAALPAESVKIITGGPMMGLALSDDSLPVLKSTNAILCLTAKESYTQKDRGCIRCGRCLSVCPMNLSPNVIERYAGEGKAGRGSAAMLKKLNAAGCMECGCCAYVCPAKRPLVQSMRKAKGLAKNTEADNA